MNGKRVILLMAIVVAALLMTSWLLLRARDALDSNDLDSHPVGREQRARKPLNEPAPDPAGAINPGAFVPPQDHVATARGRGRLVILRYRDRAPVADHLWSLEPVGHEADRHPITLRSDAEGVIEPAAGRWSITSSEGGLAPLVRLTAVEAGSTAVLLVQEVGDLRFIVSDQYGSPLPGVRGVWMPRHVRPPPHAAHLLAYEPVEPAPVLESRSDSNGGIVFDKCPIEAGTAHFVADGFLRATRLVNGAVPGPVRVSMQRAEHGPRRRLRFHSILDGTPVSGVSIWYPGGFKVAEGDAESNEVAVPVFVEDGEQLVVRGEGVFPTKFTLGDAERIPVYPPCDSSVVVESPAEPGAGVLVLLAESRGRRQEQDGDVTPVIRQRESWEVRTAVPTPMRLPQGIDLRLTAIDQLGRSGHADVHLASSTAEVAVPLEDSANLWVQVLGEGGRPLSNASATVKLRRGRVVRIQAEGDGMLRLPAGYRATWIWPEAPGYARGSIYRKNRVDFSPYESIHLAVTLKKAADLPIVVRTRESVPIPGVTVSVARHKGRDHLARPVLRTSPEGIWKVANPRWIVEVTNQEGGFVAHKVVPGLIDVHVGLPSSMIGGHIASGFYKAEFRGIDARDSSEIVLRCRMPRLVSLLIFEEAAARPGERFEIRRPQQREPTEVAGNMWQGWVDPNLPFLEIGAPDLGKTRIDPSRCPGDAFARVALPAAGEGH